MLPEILPPPPPSFLPRVTYQRRPYDRSRSYGDIAPLSYDDDDEDGSVVSERDIRKISGTYQDFYAAQLALARYVSSVSTCMYERDSELWIDNAMLCFCHSIAIYFRSR